MHDSIPTPGSTRLHIAGGHVDVDRISDQQVDLTLRVGDRAAFGISLASSEARAIGVAMHTASTPAPGAAYRRHDDGLGMSYTDEQQVPTSTEPGTSIRVLGRRDHATGAHSLELYGDGTILTPHEALELAAHLHALATHALASA